MLVAIHFAVSEFETIGIDWFLDVLHKCLFVGWCETKALMAAIHFRDDERTTKQKSVILHPEER